MAVSVLHDASTERNFRQQPAMIEKAENSMDLAMPKRLAPAAILLMTACVTQWGSASVVAGSEPLRFRNTPGPTSQGLPVRSEPPAPRAISEACPSEQMSCYPGCANVGDTYACGKALIALAGGLAAALVYVAAAEGLSLEAFCGKYGTLCAKAEPKAEPRRHPGDTECMLIGSGSVPDWGKGLKCRYNCNGERIELLVASPAKMCPVEENNRITWDKIKWLPITEIL